MLPRYLPEVYCQVLIVSCTRGERGMDGCRWGNDGK